MCLLLFFFFEEPRYFFTESYLERGRSRLVRNSKSMYTKYRVEWGKSTGLVFDFVYLMFYINLDFENLTVKSSTCLTSNAADSE